MLVRIRKSKWSKRLSLTIAASLFTQVFYPTAAYALTSGPSQPEVQSFTPAGTSNMVDLFSGDFHYNIPLLDVGGYPINMSYASGIGMDQEASWVGLGWNLNTGCITRNMRGLPDDFAGDPVTKRANMKKNRTYGLTTGIGIEAFGKEGLAAVLGLSYSLGITYNNYNGIGFEQSVSPTLSLGIEGKGSLNASLGLSASSDGLDIKPGLSFSQKHKKEDNKDKVLGSSIGVSFNSRAGLTSTNFGISISQATGEKVKGTDRISGKEFEDDVTAGQNGGGALSFVDQTYVPGYEMPRNNYSITASVKLSPSVVGIDGVEATISGYYSESGLAKQFEVLNSYGYFNSGMGSGNNKALMDFNREKDGGFSRASINLPLANSTFDVFSISGQGIGGSFRGFRGDVGYVFDPYSSSTSVGASLGGELGAGQLLSGGLDVNVTSNNSHSSKWTADNKLINKVPYTFVKANNAAEPMYLKELGEKSVDEDLLYANLGGDRAVRNNLTPDGYDAILEDEFTNTFGAAIPISSVLKRSSRVKRNNSISVLDKNETSAYGLMGYTSGSATAHHIGEITVLRNDGARYVYGLPAYNHLQEELTFAVNTTGNCATGLVTYTDQEASALNNSGEDNYYAYTRTPAYAHSFMLSAIVSPDYVDIELPRGPSEGDLGSYTLFDYDANESLPGVQPTVPHYKWRTPYSLGQEAYYNEGLKSKNDDQKGSVVYGEKEIFYVQRISTKTHIAVFYSSDREDAHDAVGQSGERGTNSMYKLDSIALYALPDYKKLGEDAEAIKKVHFVYDYSLCPGVPNNNHTAIPGVAVYDPIDTDLIINGKLTLREVFFTYGKSRKGKIHAYTFNYADVDFNNVQDADENPVYNIKGYDRWGNYKPNTTDPGCSINDDLPAAEYPYVEEETSDAVHNKRAAAWSLTSIEVPSGGTMKIHYESDDYAFVQNAPVGQMVRVAGFSNTPNNTGSLSNDLYSGAGTVNNYLYIDLPDAVDNGTDFGDRYLKSIRGGLLYFRVLAALGSNLVDGQCDYVSGYAPVGSVKDFDYGLNPGSNTRAWIKLSPVVEDGSGSAPANPISKAAWQFARMHNSRLAYSTFSGTNPTGGILDVLNALANASLINQIINLFEGPNGDLRNRDCGKKVVIGKSWVRLYNPDGRRHGGGARVSKIEISDEWENMTGGGSSPYTTASYGQEFFYDHNGNGNGMSSGVATYEPQLGGDENVFRKPVYMTTEHLLAPDDVSYLEEPFGESFFPSPSVGYGKVTVRNIVPAGVTINNNATGYTVNEFYTAKDFPTYTERTGILPVEKNSGLVGKLLKLNVKNYMTATQGYLIELNDMHGKQKAQWVYQQGKTQPLSGVEYRYATKTVSSPMPGPFNAFTFTRTALDNKVVAIEPDNDITYAEVGREYEFTTDLRESVSEVSGFTTNGNLAVFLAVLFPIPVPTIFPGFNTERTQFRSAVNTKVVNRYGVLRETVAYDLGSKVSTENLAYDAQTGEVLLTKTINNFDDPIYNFNYPAHWAYEGMGQAYHNIGVVVNTNITAGGSAGVSNGYVNQGSNILLVPGDEVSVSSTSATSGAGAASIVGKKAWVWDNDEDHSDVYLIDKEGVLLANASNIKLKVLRSGRRNMQSMPVGQITLRDNPLEDTDVVPDGIYDRLSFANTMTHPVRVLQASSTEFAQNWGTYCNIENNIALTAGDSCNCQENTVVSNFIQTFFSNLPLSNANIDVPDLYSADYVTSIGYTGSHCAFNGLNVALSNTTVKLVFTDPDEADCIIALQLVDEGNDPILFPGETNWTDLLSVVYLGPEIPDGCDPPTEVNETFFLGYFGAAGFYKIRVAGECLNFLDCGGGIVCQEFEGTVINPYRHNVRGVYRPKKQWLPLVDRKQENYALSANHHLDIRNEGEFTGFSEFWNAPSGGGTYWSLDSAGWTWSNEVTKFDPYGNEVENRDALKRSSGAVYGYNNKMAIAVGSNTTFNQIAFDGFEDYGYKIVSECCKEHFDFYEEYFADTSLLSDSVSHTGRYSMKVETSGNIATSYKLQHDALTGGADDVPYTVKDKDILGYFSPNTTSAKKYVLSYWVRSENPTYAEVHSYNDVTAGIGLNTGSVTVISTKKSPIIDGWQQVEIVFSIPSYPSVAADEISFTFNNASATRDAFVDDIRLHPFNSSMKSFVYDPVTLRLWAELDERNFATLYEYDQEGALIRVKKETERGIMTIQESRNGTRKKLAD